MVSTTVRVSEKKKKKKSDVGGCLNLTVKYIILLSNCFYSTTILVSLLPLSSSILLIDCQRFAYIFIVNLSLFYAANH